MSLNKYYLFSYSCTKYCKTLSAISCQKNVYFEKMRNFVQTWFLIDTKMMRNLVQKKHFVLISETKLIWKKIEHIIKQ